MKRRKQTLALLIPTLVVILATLLSLAPPALDVAAQSGETCPQNQSDGPWCQNSGGCKDVCGPGLAGVEIDVYLDGKYWKTLRRDWSCGNGFREKVCGPPGYGCAGVRISANKSKNGCTFGFRVDLFKCEPTPTPTPTPTATPTATPEPPPPPCNVDLPTACQDTLSLYDYGLQCDEARVDVPCSLVDRGPYPRGMVTVKNTFEVVGPDLSGDAWTRPEPQGYPGQNFRNYRVGIRWRRVKPPEAPDIAWNYDERPWNVERGVEWGERGNPVDHTYETSSWDKPENGPGQDCVDCLPSYQVYVQSSWRAQCAAYWEHYECVERDENNQCLRKDWVPRTDGWYDIDMRSLGSDFPYIIRMPDGVDFYHPEQECGVVPVPIIEVQGVIEP